MEKQTLKLETIGDIDNGGLRIAFNEALATITQDLANRLMLAKSRSLVLKIDFMPNVDFNSSVPQFEHADVVWQIETKVPPTVSKNNIMKPDAQGQLYFKSDLPTEPDNETLDDEAQRVRAERRSRGETD
jgi:hypothetical protein